MIEVKNWQKEFFREEDSPFLVEQIRIYLPICPLLYYLLLCA